MTSRRTARYGILLSIVLALFLTMALAACTDEATPEGTPGSLLERATEREATQEAGPSATETPTGSQSLFGRATPGPTEEGESPAAGPTPTPTPTAEEAAQLDRAALVALYQATGGPSWTDNAGWLSDSPIGQWHGVTAFADGRVTALALDDNNLTGTVPPELRALTALAQLDLGGNRLDGCLPANLQPQLDVADSDLAGLPFCVTDRAALVALYEATNGDSWTDNAGWLSDSPIGQWRGVTADARGRVTALALDGNNLVGTVPPKLHALTALTQLDLGGNRLDGCLPANLQDQLARADSDLAGLPFCCGGHGTPPGSAPAPKRAATPPPAQTSAETDKDALVAIFDATDGSSWDRSGTWAGRAPIGEWPGVTTDEDGRVVKLDLNLGGAEIPPEVGHLTGLTTLKLTGVSGALPQELGYLANLAELDLSNNRLCGALPPELGSLASLVELDLSGSQLSGGLPPELDSLGSLQSLNLEQNQLSGAIPPELGSLGFLQSLNLAENQLTGKIPPELGSLGFLQSLNLAENQLTGKIPPELGSLGSLQSLDLGGNQLTGDIPPELGSLGNLQSLNLESNQLAGDIPPELDILVSTLREIRFDGNQFGGCISDLLRDAGRYAGEIPVCTPEDHPGDTEALIALYNAWGDPGLKNWLSRAPISEWAGVSVDANGRVASMNLGGISGSWTRKERRLSGEISPEVGNLESLQVLNLSGNKLTGEVPELGSLESLQVLNLSGNKLTGEVPELGSLESLQVLNLSGNELTGEVPELGSLESLQVLNLSGNELTGELPELGSLESLQVLDLAGNWLTGGGNCVPTSTLSLHDSILEPLGELCLTVGEFVSVSAGRYHTCGVKPDGSVKCWSGNRLDGRRDGISRTSSNDTDRGQTTPPEGQFASVSAGGDHTCGVRTDGSVACWGSDEYGQTTPPEGQFASVSAGSTHTCGVRTDDSVACWGNHDAAQATPPEGQFASVSARNRQTCGVRTDGSVACWGWDENGFSLPPPPEGQFASVSAGYWHTCGVRTDGSVACWGKNDAAQATLEGQFASVSVGKNHICGVRTDGSVACWDKDYAAQARLGGQFASVYDDDGRATPPEGQFASVSAGRYHTCGVRTDGSVACWGSGYKY